MREEHIRGRKALTFRYSVPNLASRISAVHAFTNGERRLFERHGRLWEPLENGSFTPENEKDDLSNLNI
jgi:hypothetical protein